ncbi:hypothetical protein [Methylobacterium sp. yr596]|uniref:hypothetical protein n=1 Tax=Methylobacterium sp. yr596 TaxID=1761800 RepID=UPI0008ED1198|nr:hypothetical protein [Methylobacterium sp. yr596]SFF17120.1 hypothetical protein SAMN04487844_11110 [Methylobacterium sp. yr596]
MKVEDVIISVDGNPRAAIDVALDFVRRQSCGEWDDKQISDDATALARVLSAFRDAHLEVAGPIDGDAYPIDLPDLYRRVRRLEEKVLP